MAMADSFVPLIDISKLTAKPDLDFTHPELKEVCRDIVKTFEKSGFACFSCHGISPELVDLAFSKADEFFAQDRDSKSSHARQGGCNQGWVGTGVESLNPQRPGDLKEAFNLTINQYEKNWPDPLVPKFKDTLLDFYAKCDELSQLTLKAMAVGLDLPNVDDFNKAHDINNVGNLTTLRCLHYPPLPPDADIKEGQVRCGEHSDYGSITLLFQEGGIEVLTPEGEWWRPPSVPDTVLVNVGDLMQRWTSDRLKSTVHRVTFPADDALKQRSRRSMAFFVHPNDSWLVECLDGSQKYAPITALDYLNMRFQETYK